MCLSSLQLANLPNLRDYAKAPFTLALVMILIAMVVRPMAPAHVLLLSLAYGLVLGIGYGFRTDLLVDIPPFLIAVALFLPGGLLREPAGEGCRRHPGCRRIRRRWHGRSSRRLSRAADASGTSFCSG